MKSISLLLSKKTLEGFEPLLIKKILIEIIKEKIKVDVPNSKIKIQEGVIVIDQSGPLKTELMIRKQEILKDLKYRLNKTDFNRKII